MWNFLLFLGFFFIIRAIFLLYRFIICYINSLRVNVREKYNAEWAAITGASSGLGKNLAVMLAEQKVNIIGSARDLSRLEDVKAECESKGVLFISVVADFSDNKAVDDFMEACGDKNIGAVFINAGLGIYGSITNTSDDKIVPFVNLMCTQYALLSREFMARFKNRKDKSLIYMTASLAADSIGPLGALYCSVKAYVSRLGKQLSLECAGTNIDVTAMHPGFFGGSRFFDILPPQMSKLFSNPKFYPLATDTSNAVLNSIGRTSLADFGASSVLVRVFCWFVTEFPQYLFCSRAIKIAMSKSSAKED